MRRGEGIDGGYWTRGDAWRTTFDPLVPFGIRTVMAPMPRLRPLAAAGRTHAFGCQAIVDPGYEGSNGRFASYSNRKTFTWRFALRQ